MYKLPDNTLILTTKETVYTHVKKCFFAVVYCKTFLNFFYLYLQSIYCQWLIFRSVIQAHKYPTEEQKSTYFILGSVFLGWVYINDGALEIINTIFVLNTIILYLWSKWWMHYKNDPFELWNIFRYVNLLLTYLCNKDIYTIYGEMFF